MFQDDLSVLYEIPNPLFLAVFSVASNRIDGTIPNIMDRFVNLKTFDVSNNNLNGNLPSSLSSLDRLYHLYVLLKKIYIYILF